MPYRGRFAPSPTGDLHLGSLVAAVGSYLQARSQSGKWLIRIEDLDPPREVPGSARRIIDDLAAFGLHSDEPVIFQSSRLAEYGTALDSLLSRGLAFGCACSRSELPANGIYPGTCRNGVPPGRRARSIRLQVTPEPIVFTDLVQGPFRQALDRQVGDFIIRRGDGLVAYQLATAVDDAWQNITEVVRGADLLDSTPRQIFLQQQLGLPTPAYAHLPVVNNAEGQKLSKRTHADPVGSTDRCATVALCLRFLGHAPPAEISDLGQLWSWAVQHWQLGKVPARQGHSLQAPAASEHKHRKI